MPDADTAPTLVTGATGFVGSAVARALQARGHRLRLLARPNGDRTNLRDLDAEVVEGDLNDPASLARAVERCRYLLHVAADYRLWVPDPEAMMRANVEGTTALLRAAHKAGVERMVYCSSVAALGLPHAGESATEETRVPEERVIGHYKRSKHRAERAVAALAREEGVPVVIVNPSAPVGPRDVKPTPTGRMVQDAAAGQMPAYLNTGLNVVHVDDVAEGHCLALERGRVGESYILGGENIRLPALLALIDEATGARRRRVPLPAWLLKPVAPISEAIARRTGGTPRLTVDTLRMAGHDMYFSSAKAERELGYTHRPARDAVRDAVAWFRAQGRL